MTKQATLNAEIERLNNILLTYQTAAKAIRQARIHTYWILDSVNATTEELQASNNYNTTLHKLADDAEYALLRALCEEHHSSYLLVKAHTLSECLDALQRHMNALPTENTWEYYKKHQKDA